MFFRIGKKNRNIFEALCTGTKKVETRAATSRYKNLKAGDSISFSCAGEILEKRIIKVSYFPSIEELLKKYKISDINPAVTSHNELMSMYYSFPGYEEKIKEFGIVAMELA